MAALTDKTVQKPALITHPLKSNEKAWMEIIFAALPEQHFASLHLLQPCWQPNRRRTILLLQSLDRNNGTKTTMLRYFVSCTRTRKTALQLQHESAIPINFIRLRMQEPLRLQIPEPRLVYVSPRLSRLRGTRNSSYSPKNIDSPGDTVDQLFQLTGPRKRPPEPYKWAMTLLDYC